MWKLFHCYLSGRHDFGMWCEPGAIFLRCVHCGKRSSGWIVDPKAHTRTTHVHATAQKVATRILPFSRVAAR